MTAEVEGFSCKDVSLHSFTLLTLRQVMIKVGGAGGGGVEEERKIKMTLRNARPILFKKENKDLYCTIQTQN